MSRGYDKAMDILSGTSQRVSQRVHLDMVMQDETPLPALGSEDSIGNQHCSGAQPHFKGAEHELAVLAAAIPSPKDVAPTKLLQVRSCTGKLLEHKATQVIV